MRCIVPRKAIPFNFWTIAMRGYLLCVIAAAPILGGCWETARNTWVPETTVVKYDSAPRELNGAGSQQPSAANRIAKREGSECSMPDQCAFVLKTMVDDPSRRWMKERPSEATYANGTRQFAYRVLRSTLGCAELAYASGDMEAAHRASKVPPPGVSIDRIVRVRALNAEVARELQQEMAARCPQHGRAPTG